MCRNIRPLFNFEPPATEDEVADAALRLVGSLHTVGLPRDREDEAAKARERSRRRFA